jgi:hypothetical protein
VCYQTKRTALIKTELCIIWKILFFESFFLLTACCFFKKLLLLAQLPYVNKTADHLQHDQEAALDKGEVCQLQLFLEKDGETC